jgi:hypothetical protein
VVKIIFVKSADNKSDGFTKNISGDLFEAHSKDYVWDKSDVGACVLDASTAGRVLKDALVGSLESLMESPVGSSGSFGAVTGSLLVAGLGVLEEQDALEAGSWNGSLKGLSPDP